jgi:GDPmannose 4,6-dehydratase
MKTALITGVTGQDGAYLAKFLLNHGYQVYGTYRRTSTPNFWRIQALGIFEHARLCICENMISRT